MAKLKSIRLINFGGYRDTTFNFDFSKQPMAVLYGANGSGKSSILEAIRICSNPLVFEGRDKGSSLALKKWIYDPSYVAGAQFVKNLGTKLIIDAVYEGVDEDYNVVLSNDGFLLNELPKVHKGHAYFADADNMINWTKFQLHAEHASKFIQLAEAIYGFSTDIDQEVEDEIELENGTKEKHLYYQNVTIQKGPDKVPFALMSAGEKKIATLIRQLCDPDSLIEKDIILIDNLELHIYFERHKKVIDCLTNMFKDKQFIVTSHSGTMIEHCKAKFGPQTLYDVQKIKGIKFID